MDKIIVLYDRIKELEIWLDRNEGKCDAKIWDAHYREVGVLYASIFYKILPETGRSEADFIINKIKLPKRLSFRHVIREVGIADYHS